MTFFANIEDVIIQFTSTYNRGDIFGTSLEHPGFFDECQDPKDGKQRTWNDRLDQKGHECQEIKLVPLTCLEGIACNKPGTKYKSLHESMKIPQGTSFLE